MEKKNHLNKGNVIIRLRGGISKILQPSPILPPVRGKVQAVRRYYHKVYVYAKDHFPLYVRFDTKEEEEEEEEGDRRL